MKKFLTQLLALFTFILTAQNLIDPDATKETKALYSNLKTFSKQNILFGHHESGAYGTKWKNVDGKSDVKDVCGSYPAVQGWDLGKEGNEFNIDGVSFKDTRNLIIDTYNRGGINTISWHTDNPVNGKGSWDTTRAVVHILPGGKFHDVYLKKLDHVADFLTSCTSGSTMIPIIFRPFHEHNGNWFWWGKGNCTEQEYIVIWKFTVDYLKNIKGLHHLIYAFSPDRSRLNIDDAKNSYLYGYPGDEYVDLLGYDNYMDVGITWNKKSKDQQLNDLVKGLSAVSQLAKERNKVAALTETGLEGITNANWYTEIILNPLKANPQIQLAYIMVWRNANEKHHYAPYPGHTAVEDFMKFYNDTYTLFEIDLKNVYQAGNK